MSFLIPVAYAQDAQSAAANAGAASSMIIVEILAAIAIIGVAFVLAVAARSAVQAAIRAKHGDKEPIVILYGRLVFTAVLVIGSLIALTVTGLPLGWFSGAVGVGIAFATQGPVSNFVAGIALLTQDKFTIGDNVKIGDQTGKIVDIGTSTTTLKGFDGAQITIPNVDIITSTVVCYTKNPARRVEVVMSVSYDANLQAARDIILDVVKKHHGIELKPEPSVKIGALAACSIDLKTFFWVDPHSSWANTKDEITQQCLAALYDAGITAPYPIQTLRVEKGNSNLLADALPYLTRDVPATLDAMSKDVLSGNPYLLTLKTLEEEKREDVFAVVPTETNEVPAVTSETPTMAQTLVAEIAPSPAVITNEQTPIEAPQQSVNVQPQPATTSAAPIFAPGLIP